MTKHEKLIKVLDMIKTCDQRIVEIKKQLAYPKNYSFWLFHTKEEQENNVRFRIAVRNRLSGYYAKLVFAMASNVYNVVNEERKPSQSPNQ